MTVRNLRISYNAERLDMALRARKGCTKQFDAALGAAFRKPRSKVAQKRLLGFGVWIEKARAK